MISPAKIYTLENFAKLKEKCQRIRQDVVVDLEYYIDIAIKNLEKNEINVYLVNDAKEAQKILRDLVSEEKLILKSKTNVGEEIHIVEALSDKEVINTDCGDFIADIIGKRSHPILPLYGINIKEIVEAVSKKLGKDIKPNPNEITKAIRNYIKEKFWEAKVGITGANTISSEGKIFILENEGNISFVSRLEKHIVVASIEKINPTDEDCLAICNIQALFSLGKPPSYINIISGPSKTGDIPGYTIKGMYGSKEIYLIFIDNGRRNLLNSEFKEILKCINCGACLYGCPVFNVLLDKYGFEQKGIRGILIQMFQKSYEDLFNKIYYCTGCGYCKEICPVGIDISKLVKKLRNTLKNKGYETEVNKEMVENIKNFGNPIGKTEKDLRMFCC